MFRSLRIALLFQTVVASCPNGWLSHNQSCFLFSHDREYWPGAFQMCKIMGGQLVEIHSAAKNNFLLQQIKSSGHTFWIGLSDVSEEGNWIWMPSLTSSAEYHNWNTGQPSTVNANNEPENCAVIYTTGKWNDAACSSLYYYICEKMDQ
ncbi:perlucin-like protein isoform X2 [Mercenaria mercenaria]|nr:perlucin-like protein isoform X2 [Mercenaria mercenaria]